MDKQEIDLAQHKLFAELTISSILYKFQKQLSMEQIKNYFDDDKYSEEFIKSVLIYLTSYGIITVSFVNKCNIVYQITDFGDYFFESLLNSNNNIKKFIDGLGDNT